MSDPNSQFQPPPPFNPQPDPPKENELSTGETLSGIFFEPGRVFDSLRARPRFLVAGLTLLILTTIVTGVLFLRVDMGEYIREKMDKSPRAAELTEQQKETNVKVGKIFAALTFPVSVPIWIAAGAALYLLGAMAFGGSISYKSSLAVWVYSSLPPAILSTFVALCVLLLKAPDTIDPEHLLVTNPGAFMGEGTAPMLTALLSQFDLLRFYGLFLAAIGLRKVGRLSSGAAWSIVIGFWLLAAVLKIVTSSIFRG